MGTFDLEANGEAEGFRLVIEVGIEADGFDELRRAQVELNPRRRGRIGCRFGDVGPVPGSGIGGHAVFEVKGARGRGDSLGERAGCQRGAGQGCGGKNFAAIP